jgi:two-component system sensor histidine kinase YesM
LLIAALFSFFVTLSATRPLGFILDAVENPGKWADNQRLTKFGAENETKLALRNILNSFNLAENLKRQASIRAVLLKKAQAVVLQAQINPHFLFNTLESINLSVMELAGDDNQAVKMLDTLAELLRLSFQTRDILIPLSDELRMARKYASILQFRYFSLLDVAWDIDPALLNFCVVKFSLQPLIENALDHGIKPLGKKGTITVSVREDGGNILLSVADDGVGVAPQTLEALRKRLADADVAGGEGIGVGNVHRRARLTFGEAYGVSVTSRAGRTEFTITIPKIPIG